MSVHVNAPPSLQDHREGSSCDRSLACVSSVHCGRLLSHDDNVLSGHGTFLSGHGLFASVSGLKVQYSQLYMVEPYKSKYVPKVGDVVVGRIVSVQRARWKVDVNYRISATLHLNNVNLPGGELRRKGLEDEIAMSEHLVVGDMVSAEVQQIKAKGLLQLHTRNLKYGKLGQGILVRTFPSLIRPQKEYMHVLFDIGVTIGCNGVVWISPNINSDADGGYCQDVTSVIPVGKRSTMIRLAACVQLLSKSLVCIYDLSIIAAYNLSLKFKIKDLARLEILLSLTPKVKRLTLAEEELRQNKSAAEAYGGRAR